MMPLYASIARQAAKLSRQICRKVISVVWMTPKNSRTMVA